MIPRWGKLFDHKQDSIAHSLLLSLLHQPDFTEILLKDSKSKVFHPYMTYPIVQSMVSLTSSLRGQLVKGLLHCFYTQDCHLSSTSKFPDFSLIFPWHFTVFHTLWQIKKSFLFFTLMVLRLNVSLPVWGLLLKESICSPREQIFPLRVAPNAELDGLSLSHENVHPFPSWTG